MTELHTQLAVAEQENKKLANALLAEKMARLVLNSDIDELNSQLSQQKELLLESQRRFTNLQFQTLQTAY